MVKEREILKIRNKHQNAIQIWMEPSGVEIDLLSNQTARICEVVDEGDAVGVLQIDYYDDGVSLFESRQSEVRVYINDELVYNTSPILLNFGR